MSSRRRNGQPASCEPCRKNKVRCDHGQPFCGRCQQRNTTDRCFYHPAPLSQKIGTPAPRSRTHRNACATKEAGRKKMPRAASPAPSSVEITVRSPGTDHALPSGYFGPTSWVAAFENSPSTGFSPSYDTAELQAEEPMLSSSHLPSFWVPEVTKLLTHLAHYSTIEQLVRELYSLTQASVVPRPIILESIATMRGLIEEGDTPQILHRKTTQVLENTARKFHIPPGTKGKDFHQLFTGSRLRLEIVATVYVIAAQASFFGFAHERFFKGVAWSVSAARIKFARKMLAASDIALQVCRILSPVNDLMIWLLYESWQLCCMVLGECSSATWHRVGELSSCIFELGLHRESHVSEDMPFFLREIRRRVFAGFYQLDKNLSTFLGRPPHLSWRYSDTKPPLDISDIGLLSDGADLEQALAELDNDGWNTHKVYQFTSWYRQRYMISTFREEILELSLRPLNSDLAEKLKDVSLRCTQTWASMPTRLRYSSTDWDESLPIGIRIMLVLAYMAYLYNIFLVQRLLTQHDRSAEPALLDVSSRLLSSVLLLGRQQEPMIDLQRDFISAIVLYGFSSASILIKALQTQVRTGQPLAYTGSRAELIRNLSIFISHIELLTRPTTLNVNHALFERAGKMFTNILDEVLESPVPVQSAVTGSAEVDMGVGAPAGDGWNGSWAAEGMEFLDTLDFGVVFDQWVF
ncbi:hypothetical protein BJX68DRAFT_243206 [Aspergillus pseudodeflectus]|uniref:Zn(2)-C6 fungal-type domain-containing protein n=1 Tax=Aspergillus pseudodeflectus TaxID=176178 RepID=A0ABR4JWM6_9EURO